eukprot:15366863-Ditylum_brightwellii.AAC.1
MSTENQQSTAAAKHPITRKETPFTQNQQLLKEPKIVSFPALPRASNFKHNNQQLQQIHISPETRDTIARAAKTTANAIFYQPHSCNIDSTPILNLH